MEISLVPALLGRQAAFEHLCLDQRELEPVRALAGDGVTHLRRVRR